MSKLEQKVLKALGKSFKQQGAKEDRQAYLKRVAKAISDMDDDVYKALPEEVQEWYESCVAALKKKKPMPEFEAAAASAKGKATKKKAEAEDDEEEDDDSEEDEEDDEDENTDEDDEESEDDDEEESDDEDEDEDEEDDEESEEDDEDEDTDEDEEEEAGKEEDEESEDDGDTDDDEEEEEEDEEEEDEEEEDEEEDEADEPLTLKDLAVGDQVTIALESGTKVSGKVVKTLPKAATIKTKDGLPMKVKQSEIESITKKDKGGKPASAKDDDEGDDDEKGSRAPRNTGSGPELRALIIANYSERDWKKVAKLAEKKNIKFKPGTFRLMHNDAHKWVDAYLEHKKGAKTKK